MKKINFAEAQTKLFNFLKHTGRVIVIITALIIGFSAGEIYRAYQKGIASSVSSKMPQVHKIEVTSVAINDRGELMIIDRGTGKYTLFQDSVGMSIFNQYASRIYLKSQGITPSPEKPTGAKTK